MSSEDPLSKRIKRHVIGRRHNFFVATSPGFEPVCLQELLKLKPAAGEACVAPGGVEFEGRLDDCYLANLNLRSANRILMRIHTFKSSNFRKLEKRLGDIPWELYLHAGRVPKVHVSTKHCRLRHSGAVAERFRTTIAAQLSRFEHCKKTSKIASVSRIYTSAALMTASPFRLTAAAIFFTNAASKNTQVKHRCGRHLRRRPYCWQVMMAVVRCWIPCAAAERFRWKAR